MRRAIEDDWFAYAGRLIEDDGADAQLAWLGRLRRFSAAALRAPMARSSRPAGVGGATPFVLRIERQTKAAASLGRGSASAMADLRAAARRHPGRRYVFVGRGGVAAGHGGGLAGGVIPRVRALGGGYDRRVRAWWVPASISRRRLFSMGLRGPAAMRRWQTNGNGAARGAGRDPGQIQRYISRMDGRQRDDDGLLRDNLGVVEAGTIGATPAARDRFWRARVASERPGGRLSVSLTGEVPFELLDHPREVRRLLAQIGHAAFGKYRLGWYGVAHRPGPEGDPRNLHLHLLAADRPVERRLSQPSPERVGRQLAAAWIEGARADRFLSLIDELGLGSAQMTSGRGLRLDLIWPVGEAGKSAHRSVRHLLALAGVEVSEQALLCRWGVAVGLGRRMEKAAVGWRFGRKVEAADGPTWVKSVRAEWAAACNKALTRVRRAEPEVADRGDALVRPLPSLSPLADEAGAAEKWFHPGGWHEVGVRKGRGHHLGRAATRLERAGVPTRAGVFNAYVEAVSQAMRRVDLAAAYGRKFVAHGSAGTLEQMAEAGVIVKSTLDQLSNPGDRELLRIGLPRSEDRTTRARIRIELLERERKRLQDLLAAGRVPTSPKRPRLGRKLFGRERRAVENRIGTIDTELNLAREAVKEIQDRYRQADGILILDEIRAAKRLHQLAETISAVHRDDRIQEWDGWRRALTNRQTQPEQTTRPLSVAGKLGAMWQTTKDRLGRQPELNRIAELRQFGEASARARRDLRDHLSSTIGDASRAEELAARLVRLQHVEYPLGISGDAVAKLLREEQRRLGRYDGNERALATLAERTSELAADAVNRERLLVEKTLFHLKERGAEKLNAAQRAALDDGLDQTARLVDRLIRSTTDPAESKATVHLPIDTVSRWRDSRPRPDETKDTMAVPGPTPETPSQKSGDRQASGPVHPPDRVSQKIGSRPTPRRDAGRER